MVMGCSSSYAEGSSQPKWTDTRLKGKWGLGPCMRIRSGTACGIRTTRRSKTSYRTRFLTPQDTLQTSQKQTFIFSCTIESATRLENVDQRQSSMKLSDVKRKISDELCR